MPLALRWVFCTDIRTDSDFCFIHHWLTGFYNRGGKCLLRGTDWFIIQSRLRFVFKRLKQMQTTPRKSDQVVTLVNFKQEVSHSNLGRSTHCREDLLWFLQCSLCSFTIMPEIVPRTLLSTSCVVGYYCNPVLIRCLIVCLLTALLNRGQVNKKVSWYCRDRVSSCNIHAVQQDTQSV